MAYHIHFLNEKDLKYVISPEIYGPEYLEFRDNFRKWKTNVCFSTSNNLAYEAIVSSNQNKKGDVIVDKKKIVEHIVDLKFEELIHKKYDKTEHLAKKDIRDLLDSIVRYYMNKKMKMEPDLVCLSRQIAFLFPNESMVRSNTISNKKFI